MLSQRLNWILDGALKGPVVWEMFYPLCFLFFFVSDPPEPSGGILGTVCCRLRWQAGDISESTHVKSALANVSGCLHAHTQTNTQAVLKSIAAVMKSNKDIIKGKTKAVSSCITVIYSRAFFWLLNGRFFNLNNVLLMYL